MEYLIPSNVDKEMWSFKLQISKLMAMHEIAELKTNALTCNISTKHLCWEEWNTRIKTDTYLFDKMARCPLV